MRIWLATIFLALGLCNAAQAARTMHATPATQATQDDDAAIDYAVPMQAPDSVQPPDVPMQDIRRVVPPDQPMPEAERILDFDSDVTVQKNGDMDVAETIEVQATGEQISHGLLRDFPTTYKRPDGSRVKVDFDVRSVTRDGAPEPYTLERLSNGVRIRIGSASVTLTPGQHRFVIRYSTSRQIGFFPEFDELYWNVTGNGWTFPIDHATATIHLPEAVPIVQSAFYTGPQGSRDKDARVTGQGNGYIGFATTAHLGAGEGLTVAAAWRKGLVLPPTQAQIVWYNVRDNLDLVASVLGFVLLAAYYAFVFVKTRRRTPSQVVPLYEPPDDMSAPAVQYMVNKRHGTQALSLAIMEMIALRAMRIDKSGGTPKFRRIEETSQNRHALQRDGLLAAMLEKLFRTNKSFSSGEGSEKRFSDARSLMETTIDQRFKPLIDLHRPLVKRGFRLWLLFLAACIGAAWAVDPGSAKNTSIIAPLLAVAVAALTFLYGGLRSRTLSWGLGLFGIVFLLPFLVPALAMLVAGNASVPVRALPAILPALMLPVVIRAYAFAKGYTPEGDKVMDQLAGFKQYLTLAEGPRLEALVTTEEKLQVYERYLPYAIALGVGSKWAAAFAGLTATVAGMAAVQAMEQYYGGHDLMNSNPTTGLRGVSNDIAAGSTSSASSSSSSPGSSGSWSSSSSDSSSSGSSGGGSSGGGGGGGGGSGW
jgi:uncharacterized membrane protein YgcG